MSARLEREFAEELQAKGHAPGKAIAKCSYTHDAMIDLIVATPGILQGKLAEHFGYTEGWVSQVIASDAFQSRLAERKDQIIDPLLRRSAEEHIKALVIRSLEILHAKLDRPTGQIPDNLALRAFELGAKAMGLGGNAPPPAPKSPDLTILAERLVILNPNARRLEDGKVIEGTVVPQAG